MLPFPARRRLPRTTLPHARRTTVGQALRTTLPRARRTTLTLALLAATLAAQKQPRFHLRGEFFLQGGFVQSLCYSSVEWRLLASGGVFGDVALWDTRSHRRLHTFAAASRPVKGLAFDNKRRRLAVMAVGVSVWDVSEPRKPKLLKRLPSWRGGALAYSPDGRWLAFCSQEKEISLLDAASLELRKKLFSGDPQNLTNLRNDPNTPTCLAFTQDGKVLAAGTWGLGVRLFDLANGGVQLLDRERDLGIGNNDKPIAYSKVVGVGFSAAGRLRVAWAEGELGFETGEEMQVVRVHAARLPAETKSVAPQVIIRRRRPQRFTRPDPMTKIQSLASVWLGPVDLYRMSQSAGGRVVASGAEKLVRVYRDSRQVLCDIPGATSCTAIDPGGRFLAAAGLDGRVRIWQLQKKPAQVAQLFGNFDAVNDITFSADGRYLIATAAQKDAVVLDVATGKLRRDAQIEARGHALLPQKPAAGIAGHRDSVTEHAPVWVVSENGIVKMDPATGRLLEKRVMLALSAARAGKLVLSPDGEHAAVLAGSRGAGIVSLQDGSMAKFRFDCRDLSWAPDGAWLFRSVDVARKSKGRRNGTLEVVGVDGKVIRRWQAQKGHAHAAAVSPDGKTLLWSEEGRIVEMDRASWKVLRQKTARVRWWRYLDKRWALSHDQKSLTLWDRKELKPIARYPADGVSRVVVWVDRVTRRKPMVAAVVGARVQLLQIGP